MCYHVTCTPPTLLCARPTFRLVLWFGKAMQCWRLTVCGVGPGAKLASSGVGTFVPAQAGGGEGQCLKQSHSRCVCSGQDRCEVVNIHWATIGVVCNYHPGNLFPSVEHLQWNKTYGCSNEQEALCGELNSNEGTDLQLCCRYNYCDWMWKQNRWYAHSFTVRTSTHTHTHTHTPSCVGIRCTSVICSLFSKCKIFHTFQTSKYLPIIAFGSWYFGSGFPEVLMVKHWHIASCQVCLHIN